MATIVLRFAVIAATTYALARFVWASTAPARIRVHAPDDAHSRVGVQHDATTDAESVSSSSSAAAAERLHWVAEQAVEEIQVQLEEALGELDEDGTDTTTTTTEPEPEPEPPEKPTEAEIRMEFDEVVYAERRRDTSLLRRLFGGWGAWCRHRKYIYAQGT